MSSAQNTTVAVTGGAGGLGKAIATAFLEAGGNVVVCDVNQDRLSQCEEGWKSYEGRFLTSKTDITNEAAVQKFIDAAVTKFGRLDMAINNAGVMDTFDPVGTTTKANWDRIININLTGAFLVTKSAVKQMEAQSPQGGTIINIGSVASYRGVSAGLAYTVSKHGLMGLSKNTAGFYGDKKIYSIMIMIGGMEDTNLVESFGAAGGMNQQAYMHTRTLNPGYVIGETKVAPADVAKYCIFLTDRGVAESSNGGVITFNKNWPAS